MENDNKYLETLKNRLEEIYKELDLFLHEAKNGILTETDLKDCFKLVEEVNHLKSIIKLYNN